MDFSAPAKEDQQEHVLTHSSFDGPENQTGPPTLPPPPFNLTASSASNGEEADEQAENQTEENQPLQLEDGSGDNPPPSIPNDEGNPSDNPAPQKGANGTGTNDLKGKEGTNSGQNAGGVVPPLMLFGEELAIDVSGVKETISMSLNLAILPGCKATRLKVILEEGAFVSGTLFVECHDLAGIEMELKINAGGEVQADLSLKHTIMGFEAVAQARISKDGIVGNVLVQIPAGQTIVQGLKTTGGSIYFVFEEKESFLRGNLAVATDDGLTTGHAQVAIDLKKEIWSGQAEMVSKERTINVSSGVDIVLPAGFAIKASFGGENGLQVEGSATVVPQVQLLSTDGMEAGGSAELDVKLTVSGLQIGLKKAQLVVTGGLNAPAMSGVFEEQHLTNEVDAGAVLTLLFEDSNLSKIELEATGGIDSATRRIGRLSFAGQAEFNPFRFMGVLHGVTNATLALTEGHRFNTILLPSSQFFISLENGEVANVDASLGIEVVDQESALAQLKVASSLPKGQGLSMEANLDLLKKMDLSSVEEDGYGVTVLPAAGLGASMEKGALTKIEGALPIEVADKDGKLVAGNVEGLVTFSDSSATLQDGQIAGVLSRELVIDLDGGKIRIANGTSLEAIFTGGKLTSIGGKVDLAYITEDRELMVSAELDYDPSQGLIRKLDAAANDQDGFELFGIFRVSEYAMGLSIRDNQLIAAGAEAKIEGEDGSIAFEGHVNLAWRGEEGGYVGDGSLDITWLDGQEEDKFLEGQLQLSIDGEQFSVEGNVQLGLMEGMQGSASIIWDENNPLSIDASLAYQNTLSEGQQLWGREFELELLNQPIPPFLILEAGLKFGASISSRPLRVFGEVGVNNWQPQVNSFPDFQAVLGATWGIDLDAKALVYLGIQFGGLDVLELAGGVSAGVGLKVPIELAPAISLFGSEEGVWGEVGLDLSIKPILNLLVEAYLNWSVLSIWKGEMTKKLLEKQLAGLGEIEWSGSFAFGDKDDAGSGQGTSQPTKQVESPKGTEVPVPKETNTSSSLGYEQGQEGATGFDGLNGLTEGLNLGTDANQIGTEGLAQEFEQIGVLADGITAVGKLLEVGAKGIGYLVKGQIIRFIIWLIKKDDKPSEEEMLRMRQQVEDLRKTLLKEYIPNGGIIDRMLLMLAGRISVWDAIFNPSRPFQILVDDGVHRETDLEGRAEIIQGMLDGRTTGGDESRILVVLNYTLNSDGPVALRELFARCGGYQEVRKNYESKFGQDKDERKRLGELHIFAYGYKEGEQNPNPDHEVDTPHGPIAKLDVSYTAEPGATVAKAKRSWEDLAEEAYGDRRYALFLTGIEFNQIFEEAMQAYETAYAAYQEELGRIRDQNKGNIMHPDDADMGPVEPSEPSEPTSGSDLIEEPTYSGPPRPADVIYIPTQDEIIDFYKQNIAQTRLSVPGSVQDSYWFESFELIAEYGYGDAKFSQQLRMFNKDVKEVEETQVANNYPGLSGLGSYGLDSLADLDFSDFFGESTTTIVEGSTVALPVVEELPPLLLTMENMEIGDTGHVLGVTDLGGENIFMWIDIPEQRVLEVASQVSADPDAQAAVEQLIQTAQLTGEETEEEVKNAMIRSANTLKYLLGTGMLQLDQSPHSEVALEDAEPGDWVSVQENTLETIAGQIYGHRERAAWIEVFNQDRSVESKVKLPTWGEMKTLDPLPLDLRGLAPRSLVQAKDGDTWGTLATKAYEDWSLGVSLSEIEANLGKNLTSGTLISLPSADVLSAANQEETQPEGADVEQNPQNSTGDTGDEPPTSKRDYTPGTKLTIMEGDTWSAIAKATYGDFSLFVKLSNHPENVALRTLPVGAKIYLPTKQELEEIEAFSLGLSPTGNPLLTEMLRVPTQEEMHHVWVEDQAEKGESLKGVWMMASTPTPLVPTTLEWMDKAKNNPGLFKEAKEVHEVVSQGAETKNEITTMPPRLKKIVDGMHREEEEGLSNEELFLVQGPEGVTPAGITMRDMSGNDVFLKDGSLVRVLDEDHNRECKIQDKDTEVIGFVSLDTRTNHLIRIINLDEVTVTGVQGSVNLIGGRFELATGKEEIVIEDSGESGVSVPVHIGDLASGEMKIYRDENGFRSVGDKTEFLPAKIGDLGEVFGDDFAFGVKARIENDAVIAEAVCMWGEEEIGTNNLESLFQAFNIPGVALENTSNVQFVNGFYDGNLMFQLTNIPIKIGDQFEGSLDIGFVKGVPSITARAIIQVTPSIMGVVDLTYGASGFSGSGNIQFVQGPISGELEVKMSEGSVEVTGTGSVSTEGFDGTVTLVYGRESYVNEVIDPELAVLGAGGEIETPQEAFSTEGGSGDWKLAGFVVGTVPLTENVELGATGIIDSTGGLTLGLEIENGEPIPLTKKLSEQYDLDLPVRALQWGIPKLGALGLDLNLFLGLEYNVEPLTLVSASASGVFSQSEYSKAPSNNLKLGGKIDLATQLKFIGGVSAAAVAELLGNTASVEIGGKLSAKLDVNTFMEAEIGVDFGAGGIDPNFKIATDLEGDLGLELQGFLKANFSSIGDWVNGQSVHYTPSLEIPIGSFDLKVAYDPTQDEPLTFIVPEEGMFQLNDLETMLNKMHLVPAMTADEEVPDFDMPTQNEGEEEDATLSDASEDAIVGVKAAYQNPAGEIHTLKVEKNDGELEIWRHSKPALLLKYCEHLIKFHQDSDKPDSGKKVTELQELEKELKGDEWTKTLKNAMKKNELRSKALAEIQDMALKLRRLDEFEYPVPTSPKEPHVAGGGRPTKSVVSELHQSQGNLGQDSSYFNPTFGATPQSDSVSTAWRWLESKFLNRTWIKFHIINDNLGGLAIKENLIATTHKDNGRYLRGFEKKMKDFYFGNKVVWMQADIKYHDQSSLGDDVPDEVKPALPKKLDARGGVMNYENGIWKPKSTQPSENLNYSIPFEKPKIPREEQFFEVNEESAYTPENMELFLFTKANGERFLEHLKSGGEFIDDSDKINGEKPYDPTKWPPKNAEGLVDTPGGVLTFVKNNCNSPIPTLKVVMRWLQEKKFKF